MEQSALESLVLAALLHDIGKFAQRAGRPKSEEMEGEYCPYKNGHSSHHHVLYTDYFITHDLQLPPELDGQKHRLARLASAHHKPGESVLAEKAISIGDRLSAGIDRRDKEDTEDKTNYKTARMLSIFSLLNLQKNSLPERTYYGLQDIETDPFPTDISTAQAHSYEALFDDFREQIRQLPLSMGVQHYIDSLVSLLELFTWCIPSSTYGTEADISLFDHSITTAAIAQCLAVYHTEEGGLPGEASQSANKFILLAGDLSGIQSYIFGLSKSHSAGVAKLFRARSFELQALTMSVILALCRRLGLTPQAKIMDAGGRFTLLLPNTQKVREELDFFEAEAQEWFFQRFKGQLSLSLSYDTFLTEQDLSLHGFREKLELLQDKLEQRKLNKFNRVFSQAQRPVHDKDHSKFSENGECLVCAMNPADSLAMKRFEEIQGRELQICQECCDQITIIGRKLAHSDTKYLILTTNDQGIELFGGIRMRLEEKVTPKDSSALRIINLRDRKSFAYHAVAGHLPKFSEQDVARWRKEGRDEKLTDDETLIEVGEAKTFQMLGLESLIAEDDGLRGKPFLGALKADVDNLGLLFGIGLGDKISISRFTGLSRMLNHFFADHLVKIIRQEYANIYVVFAGGDDLFLLGPWTEIVQFAPRINEEFRRYVAHNPNVTLSAGISVSRASLPMQAVAHLSEQLLEASKQRDDNQGSYKNAVSLFGVTVPWPEFQELIAKGQWLESLINSGMVRMGLASRLLYYAEESKAFRAGDIKRGLYLSHMGYYFARSFPEDSKNNCLKQADRDQLFGLKGNPELLEKFRLPVSYALYRLRKE